VGVTSGPGGLPSPAGPSLQAPVPCPASRPCSPASRLYTLAGRPCQLTVHPRRPALFPGPADCTPDPRWRPSSQLLPAMWHSSISMHVPALIVNRHHTTASSRPPELCLPASRHLACPAHHCGAGLGSVLNRDRDVSQTPGFRNCQYGCPNKHKYQVSKLKTILRYFETKHTGIFLSPLGYDKLLVRGTE
jgi:hypothetical protein